MRGALLALLLMPATTTLWVGYHLYHHLKRDTQ